MDDGIAITKIVDAFWNELGKIEKLTGIRREAIAITLHRLNYEKSRKWEAELWKHTASKDAIEEWVEETRENAKYDEESFLELARLLPAWARRSLLEIARSLPSPRGGKRRALNFRGRQEVKRRFDELTRASGGRRRLPNYKAYEEIRKWLNKRRGKDVSLHTVRIICDSKEQLRRRNRKSLAFLSM
jgi:hypothetical protein